MKSNVPGPASNRNARLRMLRRASDMFTASHSSGGREKRGAYKPKPVTLPTLESARKITERTTTK